VPACGQARDAPPRPAGATVSPWHDIPLYLGSGAVSFVCEIPRESCAKFEVATVRLPPASGGPVRACPQARSAGEGEGAALGAAGLPASACQAGADDARGRARAPACPRCAHGLAAARRMRASSAAHAQDEAQTPIKQDVKKGNLRVYPWNIHWHYGMLPQTWCAALLAAGGEPALSPSADAPGSLTRGVTAAGRTPRMRPHPPAASSVCAPAEPGPRACRGRRAGRPAREGRGAQATATPWTQ